MHYLNMYRLASRIGNKIVKLGLSIISSTAKVFNEFSKVPIQNKSLIE